MTLPVFLKRSSFGWVGYSRIQILARNLIQVRDVTAVMRIAWVKGPEIGLTCPPPAQAERDHCLTSECAAFARLPLWRACGVSIKDAINPLVERVLDCGFGLWRGWPFIVEQLHHGRLITGGLQPCWSNT